MNELDENVLQAVARMAYEQATGHDWHTAASDPGLDPYWRAEVMRCAVCGKLVTDGEWVVHWTSCAECFDFNYQRYLMTHDRADYDEA